MSDYGVTFVDFLTQFGDDTDDKCIPHEKSSHIVGYPIQFRMIVRKHVQSLQLNGVSLLKPYSVSTTCFILEDFSSLRSNDCSRWLV